MKILIVDEIGFIRQSLTQKLSRYHFTTVAAESGEEALAILNSDFSVDAVLTSLFLPSMNAIDLYKAASKIERFNDEGVIPPLHFYLMVTREHGTSSPKMKELTREALAVGFKDLLVKPIDIELLVSKLQNSITEEPVEEPEPVSIAATNQIDEEPATDPKKVTKRIDGLVVVQNSLHALKKEMCESIDILLEEVSRTSSK
ncbi:hypothetical protein Pan241w_36130 [Gimesia alba]|uniref:Response regulatory domain-containing protein n=1 Tax=Gimesia alba TaxID=2527973 RepID=A0A517RI12_9PLAN|nr:response regulator [Gimesia alba]QDT43512.1 hypothetical protein Pan241w_36130 [Gimesia alba]